MIKLNGGTADDAVEMQFKNKPVKRLYQKIGGVTKLLFSADLMYVGAVAGMNDSIYPYQCKSFVARDNIGPIICDLGSVRRYIVLMIPRRYFTDDTVLLLNNSIASYLSSNIVLTLDEDTSCEREVEYVKIVTSISGTGKVILQMSKLKTITL